MIPHHPVDTLKSQLDTAARNLREATNRRDAPALVFVTTIAPPEKQTPATADKMRGGEPLVQGDAVVVEEILWCPRCEKEVNETFPLYAVSPGEDWAMFAQNLGAHSYSEDAREAWEMQQNVPFIVNDNAIETDSILYYVHEGDTAHIVSLPDGHGMTWIC